MKNIIEMLERSKSNLLNEYNNIAAKIDGLNSEIGEYKEDQKILTQRVTEINEAIELLNKGSKNESTSKNKKTK